MLMGLLMLLHTSSFASLLCSWAIGCFFVFAAMLIILLLVSLVLPASPFVRAASGCGARPSKRLIRIVGELISVRCAPFLNRRQGQLTDD
jgi:hypothetical protein